MNEKELQLVREQISDTVSKAFDENFQKKFEPMVGTIAAEKARSVVESMKLDRHFYGKDISGLTEKQKKDFVIVAQAVAGKFAVDTKANEAIIEEQDNRDVYKRQGTASTSEDRSGNGNKVLFVSTLKTAQAIAKRNTCLCLLYTSPK